MQQVTMTQTIVKDEEGKIISVGAPTIQHSVSGGNNVVHAISSLFGRLSYNYDEKYMLPGYYPSRWFKPFRNQLISMVPSHLPLLDGTS